MDARLLYLMDSFAPVLTDGGGETGGSPEAPEGEQPSTMVAVDEPVTLQTIPTFARCGTDSVRLGVVFTGVSPDVPVLVGYCLSDGTEVWSNVDGLAVRNGQTVGSVALPRSALPTTVVLVVRQGVNEWAPGARLEFQE